MKKAILFVLLLSFSIQIYGQSVESIYKYLSNTKYIEADLMVLTMDKKGSEIGERLVANWKQNSEWYMGYIKKHENEYPLPYDVKFGISKDEYNYFLKSSKSMTLKKADKINIEVSGNDKNTVIKFVNKFDFLGKILIFNDRKIIQTGYGDYSRISDVNNTDVNSPTGPWKGERWQLNTIDDPMNPKGILSSFTIGLLESGLGIMRYETKCFIPGNEHKFDYIFYFKIKK